MPNKPSVRNFWLIGDIDGRQSPISGGSRGKDGGFAVRVYQRSEGKVTHPITISGRARSDGTLELSIHSDTVPDLNTTILPSGKVNEGESELTWITNR